MQHKKSIIVLVVGAIAVATTLGALAINSVFAAVPTATDITSTSQTNMALGFGKGPGGGYTAAHLASALGISTDALDTAYQNAYSAALKDAVSKGLITQSQADQLSSNGTAFPFGDRWDNWLTQNGIDFNSYLANALGISVEQLKAAYQTAYNANIDQAVTNGNLSQSQADLMKGEYALYNDSTFQSSMQTAFTAAVNAAVASGVITQSQADQILSNSGQMFMHGFGGFGGPGGSHGRGGGGFMPNDALPSTTP